MNQELLLIAHNWRTWAASTIPDPVGNDTLWLYQKLKVAFIEKFPFYSFYMPLILILFLERTNIFVYFMWKTGRNTKKDSYGKKKATYV